MHAISAHKIKIKNEYVQIYQTSLYWDNHNFFYTGRFFYSDHKLWLKLYKSKSLNGNLRFRCLINKKTYTFICTDEEWSRHPHLSGAPMKYQKTLFSTIFYFNNLIGRIRYISRYSFIHKLLLKLNLIFYGTSGGLNSWITASPVTINLIHLK